MGLLNRTFLFNSHYHLMKPLLIALAIAFAGVVVTFSAISALSVPKEFAGAASSMFLGAFPYVHKQLDRQSKRPIAAFSKQKVVDLEGFVLPGAVVFWYGFFLALAATQVPPGIAGLLVGLVGNEQSGTIRIVMICVIPVELLFGYLVARWMGVRSGKKGVWLVLAAFTLVITIEHLSRPYLLSSEDRASLGATSSSIAWLQWIGGLIVWNLIALMAFLRGRKIQLRRYADYLLKKVTPETRLAILSLLREEVAAKSLKTGDALPNGTSHASSSPA
jgi:hypothetical protein